MLLQEDIQSISSLTRTSVAEDLSYLPRRLQSDELKCNFGPVSTKRRGSCPGKACAGGYVKFWKFLQKLALFHQPPLKAHAFPGCGYTSASIKACAFKGTIGWDFPLLDFFISLPYLGSGSVTISLSYSNLKLVLRNGPLRVTKFFCKCQEFKT